MTINVRSIVITCALSFGSLLLFAGAPIGTSWEIGQFRIVKIIPISQEAIQIHFNDTNNKKMVEEILKLSNSSVIIIAVKQKYRKLDNFKITMGISLSEKGWHRDDKNMYDVQDWQAINSPKPLPYLVRFVDTSTFAKNALGGAHFFMNCDFSDCDTVPPEGKCLLPKNHTIQPLQEFLTKYLH